MLSLFDLVTGRFGLSDLAGPVGTVSVIAEATTSGGFLNALSLMAFITINIGVFNLLPIPGLDGGRLFFLIIEGIRRKPVNPKREDDPRDRPGFDVCADCSGHIQRYFAAHPRWMT